MTILKRPVPAVPQMKKKDTREKPEVAMREILKGSKVGGLKGWRSRNLMRRSRKRKLKKNRRKKLHGQWWQCSNQRHNLSSNTKFRVNEEWGISGCGEKVREEEGVEMGIKWIKFDVEQESKVQER